MLNHNTGARNGKTRRGETFISLKKIRKSVCQHPSAKALGHYESGLAVNQEIGRYAVDSVLSGHCIVPILKITYMDPVHFFILDSLEPRITVLVK